MALERIIQKGTHPAFYPISTYSKRRKAKPSNKVRCADGFLLSVVAGDGTYCSPRPGDGAAEDFDGPYTSVEVGFPSARPEPWSEWSVYCENPNAPTDTVYGYVPVEMVRALVESHGGEA